MVEKKNNDKKWQHKHLVIKPKLLAFYVRKQWFLNTQKYKKL